MKKRIMRRVYIIYALRMAAHPIIVKVFLFTISLYAGAALISVGDVLLNMPSVSDLGAFWRFGLTAFTGAEMAVQLVTLAAVFLLVFTTRDIVRNFSRGLGGLTPNLRRF